MPLFLRVSAVDGTQEGWNIDDTVAFARELKRLSPSTPIVILSAYASLPGETLGLADLWIRKGEDDPQYLLSKLKQLLDEQAIS